MAKFLNQYIGDIVPVGSVFKYVGDVPPTGYMFCDGTVLKINSYLDLYNVIGVKFTPAGTPKDSFSLPQPPLKMKAWCKIQVTDTAASAKLLDGYNVTSVQLRDAITVYSVPNYNNVAIFRINFSVPMKTSNYFANIQVESIGSWAEDNTIVCQGIANKNLNLNKSNGSTEYYYDFTMREIFANTQQNIVNVYISEPDNNYEIIKI